MAGKKDGRGRTPKRRDAYGYLVDRQGRRIGLGAGTEDGLARIQEQPRLSADEVVRALSAQITGRRRFNKEQLACLFKLGELYGLWGPGRKLPKADDTEAQPAPFSMETDKAQE